MSAVNRVRGYLDGARYVIDKSFPRPLENTNLIEIAKMLQIEDHLLCTNRNQEQQLLELKEISNSLKRIEKLKLLESGESALPSEQT
jgi:hypothetical protein